MKRSLPPYWLFYRSIVHWVADPSLAGQLPVLYRILGIYCRIYFKLFPSATYLKGGRRLFYFASRLHSLFGGEGIRKMQVGNYVVYIDLLDARFLQVVNELKGNVPTKTLGAFLSAGDTFIDAGANQGGFSIVASHLIGPTGRIFAFEPQERLVDAVRLSLAQAPAKFEVFPIALGDVNDKVDYVVPLSYSGTAGLFAEFSGKDGYVLTRVTIRKCDDVLDWKMFYGSLFIKLDVEGAEYKFLSGAAEMIKALKPTILMEINPQAMKSAGTHPEVMLALLKSLGYKKFRPETDLGTTLPVEEISFQTQYNILLVDEK